MFQLPAAAPWSTILPGESVCTTNALGFETTLTPGVESGLTSPMVYASPALIVTGTVRVSEATTWRPANIKSPHVASARAVNSVPRRILFLIALTIVPSPPLRYVDSLRVRPGEQRIVLWSSRETSFARGQR